MRRVLAGVLVSGVIVAHVGWSSHVSLDWPTIALVAIVVGVVFAPEISKLLPLIGWRSRDRIARIRSEASQGGGEGGRGNGRTRRVVGKSPEACWGGAGRGGFRECHLGSRC